MFSPVNKLEFELLPNCILFFKRKLQRKQNNYLRKLYEFFGGRHCFCYCPWPLVQQKNRHLIGLNCIIIHFMNSPYNFSIQNCPQNSDRVQLRFQSPKRCIIKHLKLTELYSIEFLRTEMTSDLSNYHREYSPYGSYSLFQFERSDAISVLKNSIEYSYVSFECLFSFVVRKVARSPRYCSPKRLLYCYH